MFCIQCGKNIEIETKFCPFCGADIREAQEAQETQEETKSSYTGNKQKPPNKKKNNRVILLVLIIAIVCVAAFLLYIGPKFLNLQLLPIDPFGVFDNDDNSRWEDDEDTDKDSKPPNRSNSSRGSSNDDETASTEAPPQPQEDEPKTEETNAAGPVFENYFASSIRTPMQSGGTTVEYGAVQAFDGDWSTAWCEGASGVGIGEWVEARANDPQLVSGVRILNGYYKSENLYYKNNAVSRLKIVTEGGEAIYSLALNTDGYQEILFGSPVETKYIRFVIEDVFYATDNGLDNADDEDTLISEIQIF